MMREMAKELRTFFKKVYKQATQVLYLEELFLIFYGLLTLTLILEALLLRTGYWPARWCFTITVFTGFFGIFVLVRHLFKGDFPNRLFVYQYVKHARDKAKARGIVVLNLLIYVPWMWQVFGGGRYGYDWGARNYLVSLITGYFVLRGLKQEMEKDYLLEAGDRVNSGKPMFQEPDRLSQEVSEGVQRLNHIYESAQEAMVHRLKAERMKTELIANVSHDLKTPLTSIVNYADLLMDENLTEEEEKSYKEVLVRNAYRMKTLINDLVFASKTGSGNLVIEREDLDFHELILQSYSLLDRQFNEKNLEFIYAGEEKAIHVLTDGDQLSRVIENLLNNAQKYSLEGTRVYGESYIDQEKVCFTIKNISKEPLNRPVEELMAQFVQGDRSRHTEGSGLGLYIAQSLMEHLGGKLSLEIDGDLFKASISLPKGKAPGGKNPGKAEPFTGDDDREGDLKEQGVQEEDHEEGEEDE